MLSFFSFLSHLASTRPARIILADSRDNLAIRLHKYAGAWVEQATFPMALKPRCSSLLEKVASKASDLDVWTTIAEILIAYDLPRTPPSSSITRGGSNTAIFDSLK